MCVCVQDNGANRLYTVKDPETGADRAANVKAESVLSYGMCPEVYLYARGDINVGDELLMDYGPAYHI